MIFEISDNMRGLIAKTLGSGGSRGPKSPHTADAVFIAAARMAVAKHPWRSFNTLTGGGRHSAARRIKMWVNSGALERLKDAVQINGFDETDSQSLIQMIELVKALPGRPRSVEGRGWTQRSPRIVKSGRFNTFETE